MLQIPPELDKHLHVRLYMKFDCTCRQTPRFTEYLVNHITITAQHKI